MCPEPLINQSGPAWMTAARPLVTTLSSVPLHRVDELVYVEVKDPAAFERLPIYAEVLADRWQSSPHMARRECCCCKEAAASRAAGGRIELAERYHEDSPTRRWLRLMIPASSHGRAIVELHARLGSALVESMPVYRRGDALLALRLNVLVADVPGLRVLRRRKRIEAVLRDFAATHQLRPSYPGGSLVVLEAANPIDETELRGLADIKNSPLHTLRYQEVPMRARHTLGPPHRAPLKPPNRMLARSGWTSIPGETYGPQAGVDLAAAAAAPAPLWHLTEIGLAGANAAEADAHGVLVAVIDDRCNTTIQDLTTIISTPGEELEYPKPRTLEFITTVDPTLPVQSHGTACAGVIAAKAQPIDRTRGVAQDASLMTLCVHEWTAEAMVMAIRRVYQGPQKPSVLSLSLAWYPNELHPAGFAAIAEALKEAHTSGILIVAAAGNVLDPDETNRQVGFPACMPCVMAVGAVTPKLQPKEFDDDSGEPWASRHDMAEWYSAAPGRISVAAPGVGISTSDSVADTWCSSRFNGTSAATPQVAGLAALLFKKYSGRGPDQVRYIIEATATKVGAPSDYRWHSSDDTSTRSLKLGYGVINVEKALSFADVHLHDQIRDRTAVPAEAAPALWRSNDVKVSGTLGKLTVEVTVHNDGPAKATNVRVKVWVIAQDNLPWELTSNLALSDGSACGSGEHLVEEIEDQGEKKIEIEVVPEEALDPTFRPYLLIAVDADNDHAFKGTLPAEEATLRYYNNLARVSLEGP